MTNIYEDILANIDADKKAWCQGEWVETDNAGKPISRCLVEHVDLAVGTTYVKPNGKVFVSKDPRRWNRRERILQHLYDLLPDGFRSSITEEREPYHYTKSHLWGLGEHMRRPYSRFEGSVVDFNDNEATTKSKVRNLLKKAAKRHPED